MVQGRTHRRNNRDAALQRGRNKVSIVLHEGPLLHLSPPRRLLPSLTPSAGRGGCRLTLHVHADGLDGGHAHAVLSLAVVAAALRARNAFNAQRLVEHRRLLELVGSAARGFGPPHLGRAVGGWGRQSQRSPEGGGPPGRMPCSVPPLQPSCFFTSACGAYTGLGNEPDRLEGIHRLGRTSQRRVWRIWGPMDKVLKKAVQCSG